MSAWMEILNAQQHRLETLTSTSRATGSNKRHRRHRLRGNKVSPNTVHAKSATAAKVHLTTDLFKNFGNKFRGNSTEPVRYAPLEQADLEAALNTLSSSSEEDLFIPRLRQYNNNNQRNMSRNNSNKYSMRENFENTFQIEISSSSRSLFDKYRNI
uniref:Uncharacterized protein n=1 Tax=Glossina pallidipes TaxID=7398 RepID=A0A1B0A2A2_GLOPL